MTARTACSLMIRLSVGAARIIVGWIVSIAAVSHAQDADRSLSPMFPPSPRLATTAAELAEWKSSGEFDRRRDAACAAAEKLLESPVEIPTEWGNWIFYYACANDGTSLQPQSLTEHRCPRCNKIFSDDRTVAANRTRLYYQADRAAVDLAWAFALSDDPRFAAEVRRILLTYAEAYPKYPSRRDRWGREGLLATIGGRRYCQSLDEAVGIIALAKAYDLTRTSSVWSEDDRRKVEQDLFQTVAKVLLHWNYGTINHQTWYNAGLMAIANVTEDADLARKVVTMTGGYRDQLARAIGPDGMWREGTMAYHGYALQAMEELVDAGQHLGLPLAEEPRLRRMFEFPAAYAYPNGQFPAINDSDPISLASFDGHFRWAWKTYHEDQFARAYARGDAARTAELLGPTASVTAAIEPKSSDLPGAGVVALRRGQEATAACAMLDYGEHGGGHGHPDKLQLLLYAGDREWLLDPGRLDYSHKEHKTWYRQTVAHNTIVINGRSQSPSTGKLLWLQESDRFTACAAECSTAYDGTTLRRYLLLEPSRLIDFVVVEAPQGKTIDWLIHAVADSITLDDAQSAPVEKPLGTSEGYEHLTDVASWTPARRDVLCRFQSGEKQLRVRLAADTPEMIYSAKCPGYSLEPRIPCLVRRAVGGRVSFATVYDWAEADQETPGGRIVENDSLEIRRATGTTVVRFQDAGVTVDDKP